MNANNIPALRAIFWGGLIGGSLDILYASIMSVAGGSTPDRMLRGIAAGLLGRGVLSRGLGFALLGLALHFAIAFGAATAYFVFSRRVDLLVRQAALCGPAFGAIVHLIMNRVVLPLSALHVRPKLTLPGLFAVMFLVGLPVALSVQRTTDAVKCHDRLALKAQ